MMFEGQKEVDGVASIYGLVDTYEDYWNYSLLKS